MKKQFLEKIVEISADSALNPTIVVNCKNMQMSEVQIQKMFFFALML